MIARWLARRNVPGKPSVAIREEGIGPVRTTDDPAARAEGPTHTAPETAQYGRILAQVVARQDLDAFEQQTPEHSPATKL